MTASRILYVGVKRVVGGVLLLWAGHFLISVGALLMYTTVWPPVTGVQLQRAAEAWWADAEYTRRYEPVSAEMISAHLPHAIIAAEDGRFYEHHGIDWEALQEVRSEYAQGGELRGASTITQQLVKNLFFTTHRSYVRKVMEIPLAYAADLVLTKDRIVHLYANVVEWGPGIYGAEAAAQYHFGIAAKRLTRNQSAGLAACLPAPLTRRPSYMTRYTRIIERRMAQHGW
ncbi:monofunctional biosynthetic peptidoglycan transglycosylase [Longimonas halophila]|uniref:Monofunctional biosynthetic peptidoglycan transglycosylase n=1 Tax=Longimonas halophila TaxID=1469170 RepID=A0A2H3P1V7_9BACT|nr:monofunctional biosynthetic peptidoglycan transglycosylase [Longimonas halophila]PEN04971.1 monofunctional biosynthetic peptidoglycan transglycosylase [Longimonas halophila]